jgi:ABC-type transport system substrate-binding protein
MKTSVRLVLVVCLLAVCCLAAPAPGSSTAGEELDRAENVSGNYGGQLTIGERAEPKTLNPVIATDAVSREVIGRMNADLIDINRASQQTEPALAKSW